MSTESSKRGPYRAGIARRKEIIAEAAAMFARNGYYGGTMKDVSLRVGVTQTALGRYFESKEELIIAVMDHELAQWREYVDKVAGPDRVGLSYIRALPLIVEYLSRSPGIAMLLAGMFVEGSLPDHPVHQRIIASYRSTQESFSRHIAEAVARSEIPSMTPEQIAVEAAQFSTMLHGSLMRIASQAAMTDLEGVPIAVDVFGAFVEGTVARWAAGNVAAESWIPTNR